MSSIKEFGDYQTPFNLASDIIKVVYDNYRNNQVIIEPTCGIGAFLIALAEQKVTNELIGWEINPIHIKEAKNKLMKHPDVKSSIEEKDFFQINWDIVKNSYGENICFIGNPPWVTSSELGKLLSTNLPVKANFKNQKGIDSITGKSNFDISEWMLIKIAEFISNTSSSMNFLIKTSVARKVFQHIAKNNLNIDNISIKLIDAKYHFDVSVEACLFSASGVNYTVKDYKCEIFDNIYTKNIHSIMGFINNKIVSNISIYKKLRYIDLGSEFKWRSGIKHDASKVMELTLSSNKYINGYKEEVNLTDEYLYPMYKSSNISKLNLKKPTKYMIVPQRKVKEETLSIKNISPSTWKYLNKYSYQLDSRKSSIYKNSPIFSIFGVGDYSFKPWKVAISGMYKNLLFQKIGPFNGKPIVLDDTCYSLGFETEFEADLVLKLLTSDIAKDFINSLVFKDNKRPITVALLNRINLRNIAVELSLEKEFDSILFRDYLKIS